MKFGEKQATYDVYYLLTGPIIENRRNKFKRDPYQ